MNLGSGTAIARAEKKKSAKQEVSHKRNKVFVNVGERLRPILKLSPELCALFQMHRIAMEPE